ncbi:exonuclease domain-containing protein [Kineococcus sp. SYSU DK005]|uniref:exonuclease domain-containing protein n=1 Tax=Kineococcus sp. SYSU DK005 TaxID=3383126 RepID=UPI003D7D60F1
MLPHTRPLDAPAPDALPADVAERYPHPYAVVDVETTGMDSATDRVVQVAVVQLGADGRVEGTWNSLVDPGRDPGPTHVHGITAEALRGAPTFAQVAEQVAGLLAGRVLVAHNARFDWGFLREELTRARTAFQVPHFLCTVTLSRRLRLPVPDVGLAAVAAHWGVVQHRAHDAVDDTRVLTEVFRASLRAAAEQDVELPLTALRPSRPVPPPQRWRRPAAAPRTPCAWTDPGRWVPGEALVQGTKVVFSGDTDTPREDLIARAVDAGLDVMNGVSRTTGLLVTNEPDAGVRKVLDARRHGVPVVDEARFEGLLAAIAAGTPKEA